ncbi:NrfD/PsrC family molybdoenzyme membrane anchor subunit [Salinilacihabitans rarus]|uniref:NrfD/PsrC family molybdoenzyme membrane anchor subunit n=1 Tax=Salinilacihabitans rarus TaxID=2961596 RepID=UPI0020C938DD|nr:NrfD/PsrC family molybdoenzyme membrane anchor subunit [Salinilacihabitans rarus]
MSVTLQPLFVEYHWLPADYWDLSIAVYLFLAVVAGGGYLAGASASLWRTVASDASAAADRRRAEIARWGFLVAVVGAAGAGLAVLSHLAAISRALLFPIYLTNAGSWITIGTWILVALSAVAVLSLVLELFGEEAATAEGAGLFPRAVAAAIGLCDPLDRLVDRLDPSPATTAAVSLLGSLLAVGTLYTGFELAVVETVPLWNRPTLLPPAFLASGVAAGTGLALALALLFERRLDRVAGAYAVAVATLSGASLGIVWGGWTDLAASDAPAAEASHAALAGGTLEPAVWLVVAGFVVPLVVGLAVGLGALSERLSPGFERVGGPALIGSVALLFAGGLALRVVLLLAAAQDPVVVVLP